MAHSLALPSLLADFFYFNLQVTRRAFRRGGWKLLVLKSATPRPACPCVYLRDRLPCFFFFQLPIIGLCSWTPLCKRCSMPLCRSLRCAPIASASHDFRFRFRFRVWGLQHASHACPVYVQLMSSFKHLYAHQGLKELSRDCSVSTIVSSIIKHGRFRV